MTDGANAIPSLKHVLIGALVLAVFLLGGLWLFLRHEPATRTLSAFQQSCVEGQRRAVTGDIMPLDDESEAKALAYCDCVGAEVSKRLSAEEVAAFGLGQLDEAGAGKLNAIVAYCRDRNL
jgi:hypothetical protein